MTPPPDIALHLRGLTAAGIKYEVTSDLPWPGVYFDAERTVLVRDDLNPYEYGHLVCEVLATESQATDSGVRVATRAVARACSRLIRSSTRWKSSVRLDIPRPSATARSWRTSGERWPVMKYLR